LKKSFPVIVPLEIYSAETVNPNDIRTIPSMKNNKFHPNIEYFIKIELIGNSKSNGFISLEEPK
jgi:hypothetical protein